MTSIRGILLDIDGVLHVGMQPIVGAVETLRWLEEHGYRTCFVTNTTTMARATLAQRLSKIGLPISEQQLITAPVATANYIRQHYPGKRCWVLIKGDTIADFAGIQTVGAGELASARVHADTGVIVMAYAWIVAHMCMRWNWQRENMPQCWASLIAHFSSRRCCRLA